MPIGGESIGRAYVRILADGTGFEADAERQLRRAEPTFEKEGERQSDAYMRGFNSGLPGPGDEPLESFEDALASGRGRYDRIGSLLAGNLLDGFQDEVRTMFPDVGDRIVENLRDSLAKGDIGETGLINRLHNLRAEAAKAYTDIANDNARLFNAMEASVERYSRGLDNSGRSRQAFLRDLRQMVEVLPDAVTNTDEFRAAITDMRATVANASPRLARFRDQLAGTGETIGRFFGKGSRNDFVNFFGSFIANLTKASRALSSFTRWPGLASEQISRLGAKFRAAVDEAGGFGGAILGMTRAGLPGLITAAVTAAVSLKVITSGLGVFAAAISLASGAVLALAGSLSYALVGGLVAVSGALVPFAAGIGVAALAIAGLNKESKAVKSLGDTFKDLQKTAARGMFGKDGGGLANVERLLKAIEPIVKTVSTALGGLLKSLGDVSQSKGFVTLMESLSKILGPMVTQLGQIGGNLAIGLLQVFRDGAPLIQDFLNWLGKIAKGFADAGKGGKNSPLKKFLADVSESAKSAWGFIDNVIKIIGDLFSAGKGTGDSILSKMATKAEELHKWLSDPANKDTIDKWFQDAEKLADKLGECVTQAIKFVDALDTPTSRAHLLALLDIINGIGKALTWVAKLADKLSASLFQAFVTVASYAVIAFNKIKSGAQAAFSRLKQRISEALDGEAFDTLKQRASEAWQGIQGAWEGAKTFFTDIFNGVTEAWDTAMTEIGEAIGQSVSDVIDEFKKIPDGVWETVRLMVGPFAWLYDFLVGNSLIPDLVNAIVDWFGRLPGMILGALGNLGNVFVQWVAGVPGAVSGVIDKIVAPWRGLGGKIISGAGNIASQFGTWVSSLPGKARSNAKSVADAYSGLASRAVSRMGSFTKAVSDWFSGGPGRAKANSSAIASAYSGLAKDAMRKAGNLGYAVEDWGHGAVKAANRVANSIVDQFSGLNKRIMREIGTVEVKVKIIIPDIPRPHVKAIVDAPNTATGGVFSGAQVRMIGEAGPEAVVPLNRSLSQVDPAVRALSAFAQGLKIPNTADGTVVGGDAKMNVTIVTPTEDPRAVAAEVFARFTAASYI